MSQFKWLLKHSLKRICDRDLSPLGVPVTPTPLAASPKPVPSRRPRVCPPRSAPGQRAHLVAIVSVHLREHHDSATELPFCQQSRCSQNLLREPALIPRHLDGFGSASKRSSPSSAAWRGCTRPGLRALRAWGRGGGTSEDATCSSVGLQGLHLITG